MGNLSTLSNFLKKQKISIIVFLIILIAVFLRFYNLDKNPPSLNWDEVAFGYNAYSILETGKDEYGKFLPMYFRSLYDYKRPVYSYAVVISEKIFGVNDFGVRFPSAFFGVLTVILVFILTKELTKNTILSLLASFCLAIVPWHVQFSRPAFEATLGLFLTALGILSFLLAIRKNYWWLIVSSISFGLSQYSYLGQRIVVPILIFTLIFIFRKKFINLYESKSKSLLPVFLSFLVTLLFFNLLYKDWQSPEGNIRYKATTIIGNSPEYQHAFEEMKVDGQLKINLLRRLFHDNTKVTTLGLMARGYLTHFSPDFFFFDLGQQHHHAPGVGILYLWMLPFIITGIYYLFRNGKVETNIIIFVWLLATPIAASITWQIPHALRVAEMIIPMQIIIASGIYSTFLYINKKKKLLFFPSITILSLAVIISLIYFFHQYHIHLPSERSQEWVYGRKEMVEYAESNKNKYEKVIASTKLEFPYIFFLYYSRYDPTEYLKSGGTISGGWQEEGNKYDKYEFHRFDYFNDRKKGKYLFIGKPGEFPNDVKPLKIINYLNGDPAIYIVE